MPRKCVICNKNRSLYNFTTDPRPLYCSFCKSSEMKNCISSKYTRSNYNFPNEKKALYCSKCKEPSMIDVNTPKCNIKQSKFNLPCEMY